MPVDIIYLQALFFDFGCFTTLNHVFLQNKKVVNIFWCFKCLNWINFLTFS